MLWIKVGRSLFIAKNDFMNSEESKGVFNGPSDFSAAD